MQETYIVSKAESYPSMSPFILNSTTAKALKYHRTPALDFAAVSSVQLKAEELTVHPICSRGARTHELAV